MFGPIVIVYVPSVVCAANVSVSVLFAFDQTPLTTTDGLRSVAPGPVKGITSAAVVNEAVFIAWLKRKDIDETLLVSLTGDSGVVCATTGAETVAGTSNASVIDVALALVSTALVPSPRRANPRQISRCFDLPVRFRSACRI